MQTKPYRHPVHAYRAAQAIIKKTIAEMRPRETEKLTFPVLDQTEQYFFVFELQPRSLWNIIFWGLCCFDSQGVIIFSRHGEIPVSLWRFRRQGESRTATIIEGTIKQAFKRAGIPLNATAPYFRHDDGLYQCNISWFNYKKQMES